MTLDKKPVKAKDEYEVQTEKFLKDTQTEFKAEFLKHGSHFEDDKDKRDIYRVTLKRGNREYSFNFGQSIAHSGRYTYYKGSEKVVSNDKKELNKRVGRIVALGELKINTEQQPPSAYSVLSCLQKYEVGTFKDFCAEFGYNEDSRKAEKTYNAVVEEYNNLKMLYSDEELEKLAKIN